MKRKLILIIASVFVLSQTGCGESLMLEDATDAVTDSSVSDSDSSEATPTPRQPSGGAATIIGQLNANSDESSTPEKPDSGSDVYMADFVNSTNKDVVDLIPYEIMDLNPDRDEESDSIQLRINEDSRDHKISSLRFWIDGTITDFVCDVEEYDTFRGAYVCDLNYTDNLSNIFTVFTSSKTGRHQTTIYSYNDDVVTLSGSYGGFVDFLSIDGAGEFSITEATDIKTSEYGTMYVRKNFQSKQTYSYDVNENIQELTIASNSIGYYPEEGHFAIGYPFSLKKELTLYVNSEESYETGTLPINFRGVIQEAIIEDDNYEKPNVFRVEPEDGWTDRETNVDSPIYEPSGAGSDDFNPDNYSGWISYTELTDVANEGFHTESQQ